jgi:hypothetical protein
VSPTFLSHRTMVPSAIDSPIWGMTTGVGIGSFGTFGSFGSFEPFESFGSFGSF